MRIAMVSGSGGGSHWLPPLCSGLPALGHDVVAIISDRPGDLGHRLEAAAVEWETAELGLARPLSSRGRGRWLRYPSDFAHVAATSLALSRRLRQLRPDAVVTHQFNAILIGRLAAAIARVPLRAAMVGSPFSVQAPLPRLLDRLSLPLDHGVIAGSHHIAALYRALGVPREKIDVVYYGADRSRFDPGSADGESLRRELGIPPEKALIGQVAHFYAPVGGLAAPRAVRGRGVKGHESFLRAARMILDRRPDTEFVLAGDAWHEPARAYRATLERLAGELGIAHVTHFLGGRDDVPNILAALDVSIQCSIAENLGGTIESLMMSVPTIATRVGGMPEAVLDGQTGLLVDPDRPDLLAEAVLRLVGDRRLASRLAAAGREHALAKLTLEQTVVDLDSALRRDRRSRPQRRAST